jgi:glycosyltransferase involved in cell wall biosynthesis
MIVGIPTKNNSAGLAVVLTQLQPQLKPTDSIYIIDTSDDERGVMIAQMYGSRRLPIAIEVAKTTIYQSWNRAIEFMLDNKDDGILMINDDLLFSSTFIANLKRASELADYDALVPTAPVGYMPTKRLSDSFDWFNTYTTTNKVVKTDWMCGFCFYLPVRTIEKYGVFDEGYKVWFGDTEYNKRLAKVGRLTNEYVEHYGGMSYRYQDHQLQDIIAQDRKRYELLFPGQTPPSNSQLPASGKPAG